MERLGYKMRRNLRYYRRRAQSEFGCRFLPDLTAEQRRQAVQALFDKGTYPTAAQRAWRLEAALLAVPGHFAMGLQDEHGEWLSYITGWRGAEGTYIDWQLNRDSHEGASISTVMRGYLLEHEAERQSPAIIFVGGTSPFWSRVCEPSICGGFAGDPQGSHGLCGPPINTPDPSGRPRCQAAGADDFGCALIRVAGRVQHPHCQTTRTWVVDRD